MSLLLKIKSLTAKQKWAQAGKYCPNSDRDRGVQKILAPLCPAWLSGCAPTLPSNCPIPF